MFKVIKNVNGGTTVIKKDAKDYTTQVIAAAHLKFGAVIEFKMLSMNHYELTIIRDEPARVDAPYMTIKAYINADGELGFEHGHYDLTLERLNELKKG